MAKTIDEGFEELRSNLEITDLQEKTVSTRQKNVRKALEDDFDILDSFLTGSYRRSTMIAPLKGADLDIFIVLDPKYYEASARPDEELSSPVSRRVIEREARGQRYVLVTEPARDGGKVVTERKGIGVFIIRTRGRPAHASGDPDKGRNAIVAMAEIVLAINVLNDPRRGITTNVGLIAGGTARNTVAEECMIEVDLRFCDPANASEMEAKGPKIVATRHRNDRDGQDHAATVRGWTGDRSLVRQGRYHCKGDRLQPQARTTSRRWIGRELHRCYGHPDPGWAWRRWRRRTYES